MSSGRIAQVGPQSPSPPDMLRRMQILVIASDGTPEEPPEGRNRHSSSAQTAYTLLPSTAMAGASGRARGSLMGMGTPQAAAPGLIATSTSRTTRGAKAEADLIRIRSREAPSPYLSLPPEGPVRRETRYSWTGGLLTRYGPSGS